MKIRKEHSPIYKSKLVFNTAYNANGEPAGSVYWNSVDGTLDIKLNGVNLHTGQQLYFYGKASGDITKGSLVQFAGVQGDHILIKECVVAEIQASPTYFIGVASENITNGEFGYICWFGYVNNVYTNTPNNQDSTDWTVGDILYFSNTTGQLTNTQPTPPDTKIEISAVVKIQTGSSQTGRLLVRPTIYYRLEEMSNVDTTGIADGYVLKWDSANSKWIVSSDLTTTIWGSITGTLSDQTDLQTELDGKVDENLPITGATKTKITYDAKGLVTAGADATTDDISEGTTNKYLSATDKTDLTDGGDTTLHYHSSDRDRSNHTGTQTASTISDFDTEVANNSAVTLNTAKVTNATHTGEVTGSGALTIADNVVDEANLKLDTAPTNDYILTADDTASGGMKWAEAPASSPLTTKGDLYTYDTDNARLPIGTDGQMLIADSLETTGLKWVDTGIDEININVFTGNGTWTKPAGLKYIIVEVVGGGAGGGGCDGGVGATANSGGGGGGGYSLKKILASSLGSTETVTVGTGGAGGTGNNAGTAGGTSSFGSHCSATGGTGGSPNTSSSLVPRRGLTCGAGGLGTGGDVNGAGLAGATGANLALAGYGQVSGGGGGSMYGGGGEQKVAVNQNGNNGIGYGGGGSGCCAYNVNANYTGGSGTDGIVVVYEYMEA